MKKNKKFKKLNNLKIKHFLKKNYLNVYKKIKYVLFKLDKIDLVSKNFIFLNSLIDKKNNNKLNIQYLVLIKLITLLCFIEHMDYKIDEKEINSLILKIYDDFKIQNFPILKNKLMNLDFFKMKNIEFSSNKIGNLFFSLNFLNDHYFYYGYYLFLYNILNIILDIKNNPNLDLFIKKLEISKKVNKNLMNIDINNFNYFVINNNRIIKNTH